MITGGGRRGLAALLLAAVVLLDGGVASGASSSATAGENATGTAYMVGDSMTARSAKQIRVLRPDWDVDGVGGRQAARLVPLVRDHVNRAAGPSSEVVIALGSNEMGASAATYRRAVDLLPASTTVVLVTVYRDPRVFGQDRDDRLARISRWMRVLAERRSNVCVADWRAAALRFGDLVISDGVHPNALGKRVFAALVVAAMDTCP